jgi:hypothetical protein
LVIGYWLLVIGYWLLVKKFSIFQNHVKQFLTFFPAQGRRDSGAQGLCL